MREGKIGRGFALALVLVRAVTLAVAAGCGREETAAPTSEEEGGVEVTKVAVITPEKANDYGWNQQGVEGAQAAAAAVGAECIVQDGAGYGDITPILNQLAGEEPQLIFAWASGYNTVGPQMARQLQIPITASDPGDESVNVVGLVEAVETNGENGGYVAGVLAGKMSQTGTVAIVVSAEDLNWCKMAGGFIAGARSVAPDMKVLYVQIGQAAYADAAGGKRVTANAISGGADIIFGMGDGSSFGMMQAVETASPPAGADKVWFIDVIGDKSPTDDKGVLLSSVLWDWTQYMTEAIGRVSDGTFGSESFYLDLDNGMHLLQTPHIPDDVWAEVETAKAGVMDGSIDVPTLSSSKEVKALISSGE
jgi:simple sugar transport system substrate-binding protein